MKIIITSILLFFIQFDHSQIVAIKKQLKELFFEISLPTTKYDVRKTFNSNDIFSNLCETSTERHEIILADYTNNYKLSYIGKANEKQTAFWFNKNSDKLFSAGITARYAPEDINECTKQYNEFIRFFKSISYKSIQEPFIYEGKKIGDMYSFYSSAKSFQNNDAYILLLTQYGVFETNKYNDDGKRYSLSFTFYSIGCVNWE